MKSVNIVIKPALMVLLLCLSLVSCDQKKMESNDLNNQNREEKITAASEKKYKVTFIELGSVKCKPCIEMQKVIKSVEEKYGNLVKTIFYDVWTKEGKPYGDIYKIDAIPVQIFLDENGKEFFRHVGYFPEKDIEEVLKGKGVAVE